MEHLLSVVAQVLLGWFGAGLLTGIYHWFFDNGNPAWPLIGWHCAEFQDHHDDPDDLFNTSWLRLMAPLTFAVPFGSLAFLGLPVFWLVLAFGMAITQVVHKLAHSEVRPAWVTCLQKLGVLIGYEAHKLHHTDPYNKNYDVLNGWSNGLLDLTLGRFGPFRPTKG